MAKKSIVIGLLLLLLLPCWAKDGEKNWGLKSGAHVVLGAIRTKSGKDDYVLISKTANDWGDGIHAPNGTKATVLESKMFNPLPSEPQHIYCRFRVRCTVNHQQVQGWVQDFDIK